MFLVACSICAPRSRACERERGEAGGGAADVTYQLVNLLLHEGCVAAVVGEHRVVVIVAGLEHAQLVCHALQACALARGIEELVAEGIHESE